MTQGFDSGTIDRMGRGRPRIHSRKPSLYGRNLLRLRTEARVTQGELADATDGVVAQGDVSRLENGETQEPSATQIKALADALGVPIAEFWIDPDAPDRPQAETLREFYASALSEGITPSERKELERAVIPHGHPTVKTYYLLLEAIRSASKGDKKGH